MPAKPQSGRAIELGLALRIVSKRGRQVMFGQTGLLFANRQWVLYADVKQTGEEHTVYFPITFLNATLTAVDSVDTPNAFYRTSKITTNSLVFSVTNTGYVSSTCRAVIIGY